MQTIASQIANSQLSLPGLSTAEQLAETNQADESVQGALATREAFTSFVGETFFHQMIKAMRTSVGKPAYFHGGQAEEIFSSQLDQTLSETMTAASASQFTQPMFQLQFPKLANVLAAHNSKTPNEKPLHDLTALVRR